ncbi:hypothetical protein J9317_14020 [Metabacillus sp. KIGAM252]|uniref:Fimbrial assembly protein n=1 Tax=Metabacillus flavus TaxID=2823519 RepID=A0ABS5LGL7_9BACI|nr:hypothetical protein [Metabacillus flavus]MBS2969885.1 hypothetical protein [Metabacillus flavus]
MLAEINLLPERKRKNYASLVMILLIAVAAAALLVFMQYQYNASEADVNQLKNEDLTLQEQLTVSAETGKPEGSAFETLANAVTWTEVYPVEFVPVMDDLRKNLPNSGYFQALGYTEANKLIASVHLEESREAAFYLNRLKKITYFKSAKLLEMKAAEQKTEDITEEEISELEEQQPFLVTYELVLDREKWKAEQKKDQQGQEEKEGEKQDDSVQ